VNVRGTAAVAQAMVRAEVPQLVFASSSSVYGEREGGPFRETDPVERPISPYAATKRAGELLLSSFHYAHGTAITCARIFTAYGPAPAPRPRDSQVRGEDPARRGAARLRDGSAVRDFTFVEDLVAAWCARSTPTSGSRS